jgi:hypothetical protein
LPFGFFTLPAQPWFSCSDDGEVLDVIDLNKCSCVWSLGQTMTWVWGVFKINVWWVFQLCFNFNRIHDVGKALRTANQSPVITHENYIEILHIWLLRINNLLMNLLASYCIVMFASW